MKKIFNLLIGIIFIVLIIANLFIFYLSIKLGNEITTFETKIEILHKQNISLEKELSRLSSLSYAQKLAKQLKFTKTSQPEFLEKVIYAFVSNQ